MRYREFALEDRDLIQTQQPATVKPTFLQKLFRSTDTAEKRWIGGLPIGQSIGHGLESVVFDHSQDPALVVKVERKFTDPKNNAYYQYVRAIQPLMSSNHYLPRIYVADSFKKPEGTRFVYTMERLHDAYAAVAHIHPDTFNSFVNRIFVDPPDFPKVRGEYGIWSIMIKSIAAAAKQGDYTNIRDRKLIQACQLITKLNQGLDLHGGNFMIRYTSVGAQMVITDPVVGSG